MSVRRAAEQSRRGRKSHLKTTGHQVSEEQRAQMRSRNMGFSSKQRELGIYGVSTPPLLQSGEGCCGAGFWTQRNL